MCCPSPHNSVIQPDRKTSKLRQLLLFLTYGETVNVFLKAVLFGMLTGLFNLVSVWITYMGYATMHHCQVLIVCFSAVMDMVMTGVSWNAISQYLKADLMLMIIFWYLFVFAVVKFVVAVLCYVAFKQAFSD